MTREENMENYQQLSRNMRMIVDGREGVPAEVIGIVQDMFEQLKEQYRNNRCYSLDINNYIEGKYHELMRILESGVGEERKGQQKDGVEVFLKGVEKEVEERLEADEQRRKDEENEGKIKGISNDQYSNIGITIKTIQQINEAIQNIQSRQRVKLNATGLYGQNQIEELSGNIGAIISRLMNANEGKLLKAFKDDDEKLIAELLQAFEEYKGQRKEELSPQEAFRKGVTVGENGGFVSAFEGGEPKQSVQEQNLAQTLPKSLLGDDYMITPPDKTSGGEQDCKIEELPELDL